MRILLLTVLSFEESARDAWYGSSAYANPDAMKRALLEDWENEKQFDIENSGPLDATEADEIRASYDERMVEYTTWHDAQDWFDSGGRPTPEFPNEWSWWNDYEGTQYEFRWVNVNE